MKYTKKYAKEILDLWKDKTGYFDGSMTAERYLSLVTSQNGARFVRSGAACTHDLTWDFENILKVF